MCVVVELCRHEKRKTEVSPVRFAKRVVPPSEQDAVVSRLRTRIQTQEMRTLNIEVFDKRSVLLQERRDGGIEIVVATLTRDSTVRLETRTIPVVGGRHESVLAVIPKHRRNLVADFLRVTEPEEKTLECPACGH